jgi:hypothetical protein
MDTAITIFKAIAAFSVIFSLLFVAVRTYACYIRKPKGCSEGCACNAVNDQITDSVTVDKPKRKQVKKRVSAIKDSELVITKIDEPEKKKPGRKKKEL